MVTQVSGNRPRLRARHTALSHLVRAKLREHSLHQRDLAKHFRLSDTVISKRLAGDTPWTLNEFFELAQLFRMDARDLADIVSCCTTEVKSRENHHP